MSKGFFSFFKNPKDTLSEEDKQQRSYAMEKEKEASSAPAVDPNYTSVVDSAPVDEQPPVSDEMVTFCIEKLNELLSLSELGGVATVHRNSNNTLILDIVDSADLGRTIGKSGATLDALQVLVRTFTYRQFNTPFRLSIDAGEYKKKKEVSFNEKVRDAEQRVLSHNQSVELDPMNAFDRRNVHVMFENHPDIMTASVGSGPSRRVLLEPRR